MADPGFTDTFLLQENGFFLLQENGFKIIIGQKPIVDQGGGEGGKTRQVGVSLVKEQQRLGQRPHLKLINNVRGKILLHTEIKVKSTLVKLPKPFTEKIQIISKIYSKETIPIHSKIITSKDILYSTSSLIRKEFNISHGKVLKHPLDSINESIINLHKEIRQDKINIKAKEKRRILTELYHLLQEDARIVPSIQVSVNVDEIQRGDLMRITTNMSLRSGNIWMRIIDTKGMIVQKAGLVKKNATGFQVLIGTRDLNAGTYVVQVSNHKNFSPLGVAEFIVKGVSPLKGFIATIPFLLTPDSPTQKFEKLRFKTMMDSRVDSICKAFENKVFGINDKNMPIPPLHINCRCHLEGEE